MFALNKWIRYLLPNHFTVFTDHKNLEELFKTGRRKKNQRLHRWIVMLQQFDFTAKYLPGDKNFIADYLSRDVVPENDDEFVQQDPDQDSDHDQDQQIPIEPIPRHTMALIDTINPTTLEAQRRPISDKSRTIKQVQIHRSLDIPQICALRRSLRTKNRPKPEYSVKKIQKAQMDPRFRNTTKDLKRNILMKNQFNHPEIKVETRKQNKIKKQI